MLESLCYWYGEGRNTIIIQLILLSLLSGFLFAGVNHSLFYNYNYGFLKTFEMGLKLYILHKNFDVIK